MAMVDDNDVLLLLLLLLAVGCSGLYLSQSKR
jgi:hypothetical protein